MLSTPVDMGKRVPGYLKIVSVISYLLFVFTSDTFSQCIDHSKISWDNDQLFLNYNFFCPSYSFGYGGDTSKRWNFVSDKIDIRQAPPNALKFKNVVDRAIKNYAGNDFYRDLKFDCVDVGYPDRLKLFIDSGAQVTLKHYKAKYFYTYRLEPDTTTGYIIGIAVNSYGKTISPFMFPPKRKYKPVNKNFTYCKLIDIARRAQRNIDPIGEILFSYDKKKQKFYWIISQALVNDHEGINYFNQVIIDASDFNKVSAVRGWVSVTY